VILLPNIQTQVEYRRRYRDPDVWLPAMRAICERHGLDGTRLEFAPPGTHVVFRTADLYVKLFAPPWRQDFTPERLALGRLSAASDLPVPRLVAEGEIEGWPYIVITAVEGVPLCQVWDAMKPPDRAHIAARCGELMAAIHATPTEGLEAIAVDWPTFVEEQIGNCRERLTQPGLDRRWIRDILAFLADSPPLFEPGFRPVLLSADVTDEHVLVSQRGGQWELTGFIDFGDAILGHPYYDFAAPGCCITIGLPEMQRTMLLAYGFSDAQLDEALARRLTAYTLLHRFVRIPDILARLNSKPAGFREFRESLWSFHRTG
jgi:hygromycin-B 7''-O-kinase